MTNIALRKQVCYFKCAEKSIDLVTLSRRSKSVSASIVLFLCCMFS